MKKKPPKLLEQMNMDLFLPANMQPQVKKKATAKEVESTTTPDLHGSPKALACQRVYYGDSRRQERTDRKGAGNVNTDSQGALIGNGESCAVCGRGKWISDDGHEACLTVWLGVVGRSAN